MLYKCLVLLTVLAVQQTVACTTSDNGSDSSDVNQQEMTAMKAEMAAVNVELITVRVDLQGRVDRLQRQLNYWLNMKDSSNSVPSGECEVGDTTLKSGILNNITETNKETNERLERLQSSVDQLQGAMEQLQEDGCNAMTGSFHNPAHNCSYIGYNNPNTTSGYYWLQNGTGYAVQVYCDMERVCGCDEGRRGRGGWMRVADINMTRYKDNCPTGFREVTSSGKTMCGGGGEGCVSTSFSSHGVEYSRVCGKIIGYQFGSPDAFWKYHQHQTSIDSYFLDGIVLTYGSPRCHIWSFVTAHNQILIVVPALQSHPFEVPFLHTSRMTISATVDTITPLRLHLVTLSMIHYGMVLGAFEALAVSSTLLHGSVRTYLTLPLKT